MFDNLTNSSVQDASEEDILLAMGGEAPKSKNSGAKDDKKPGKSESDTGTKKPKDVSDSGNKGFNNDPFANEEDEEENEEENEESSLGIEDFLKARVLLLLKKGEWRTFEFDGKKPEDITWDEDTFEEIELQQRAWQKETLREELLESFGPYGKDIAEYASNGGNPEDLLDIFKEQQQVKLIDISTEEGQKEILYQYQTQFLKRSPQRANKEIERAIADKLLEDDAKEAKEAIENHLNDEAEAMKKEAEDAKINRLNQQKNSQIRFTADVNEILNKSEDISPDEKKEIQKLLTNFRHELPNGVKVNDFYYKLAEFRKDLKNYINMVRFVNNPERFIKTIKNKSSSAAAEKAFKLAKGSQSKKNVKTINEFDRNRSKKGTGFKLM